MLEFFEKSLCRKTASVFELAGRNGMPVLLFTDVWFSSQTAYELYNYNFYSVAQSPYYQYNSLLMEIPDLASFENTEHGFSEVLYWGGYIFSYWLFWQKLSWTQLKEKYDWQKFLSDYEYLHTLSTESAILLAQTEHDRELLARMSVPGIRRNRVDPD